MNKRAQLHEAETELADYYRQFRGGMAPTNGYTEGMWRRIRGLIAEVESAGAPVG